MIIKSKHKQLGARCNLENLTFPATPSDPIIEDLKSTGTLKSEMKVLFDGRWLKARLNS
jgi:hypothetical protein